MSKDIRILFASYLQQASTEPALVHEDHVRDWRWLASCSQAINDALGQAGLGNAAAAIIARNRPLAAAALVAQVGAGRPTAMIYGSLPEAALISELRAAGVPVVMAEREGWSDALLDAAGQAGIAPLVLDEDSGSPSATVRSGARHAIGRTIDPAVGFEILSSGTTGPAKRVPLGWSTVSAAVADAAATYAGSAAPTPQIMLHPLGNVSGIAYLLPALARRQPVVLMDKFAVDPWLAAVDRYRPGRVALPPAAVRMLLENSSISDDALAGVSVVGVGGGPLDASLQDAFEIRFGVPVLTAFGATEFGGVIASWTLDDRWQWGKCKRGSVGRACAGVSLRIVSPDGNSVPLGEVGLLEAQVDRIGPGWTRTTDLARLDEDGFLYVVGRADGAINRGGFKISPDKVARLIESHPAVAEAAVVGRADSRLGAVPVAAVELGAGARIDDAALRDWLRDRLLPYEVPVELRIVPELPRTPSMKVRLDAVAELFAVAEGVPASSRHSGGRPLSGSGRR